MKRILCFGDSNTWGYRTDGKGRFDIPSTWPGILAINLEGKATIEIDGLCGRTTCMPDHVEGEHLNGAAYLLPCLVAQSPLNMVILKLGCNDQKSRFNMSGIDIAQSIARLVKIILNSGVNQGKPPKVLVIQPAPIKLRSLAETFKSAPERAEGMTEAFAREMAALGVDLINEGDFVESSEVDGIHLELDAHATMGEVVTRKVNEILF